MSYGDLSRINTNIQSLQAYNSLNKTNANIGVRQLRLATGSKINRAEDDSAGYSISKKLEAKVRGQAQALANIGDGKSMLTVAEGNLNSIMEILTTMKEKAVQAANDTMGTDERTAIGNQLTAMKQEIVDIVGSAEFNGMKLLDNTGANGSGADFNLQVGAGTETTDTFTIAAADLEFDHGTDLATVTDVSTNALASGVIGDLDDAITNVTTTLGKVGDYQKSLSFKQDNLQTSMTNYEAARSRITDADFAKEQMEIVKLQILQQTGIASLAQANAAPQSVLSLMG